MEGLGPRKGAWYLTPRTLIPTWARLSLPSEGKINIQPYGD